jgi:hypothetical protein
MMRFALIGAFLFGFTAEGTAQTQVRLCYALPGSPFCQVVQAGKDMPVTSSGASGTGTAHQVRLCYAIPGSPFCQVVDATHPMPIK